MTEPVYKSNREAIQKGIKLTIELIKQEILSASFWIAFSILSFNQGLFDESYLLKLSIISLIISVICGVLCLSILATRVSKNIDTDPSSFIQVRIFGIIQGISFITGGLLLGLFVILV